MIQSETTEQAVTTEVQLDKTSLAKGEEKALRAIADRLRNVPAAATLNQSFRETGATDGPTAEEDLSQLLEELDSLRANIEAAADIAAKGEPLPEIEESRGTRTIDLKYTNYRQQNGSTLEHK